METSDLDEAVADFRRISRVFSTQPINSFEVFRKELEHLLISGSRVLIGIGQRLHPENLGKFHSHLNYIDSILTTIRISQSSDWSLQDLEKVKGIIILYFRDTITESLRPNQSGSGAFA